jgi:CRP-like cAMP-binding protein
LTDLYEFLTSIVPLQDNSWEEVKLLFTERELPKGAFFAEEGKAARQIGFLRKGIIRSFYKSHESQEINKHFFTANSIIGDYSSLITRRPGKLNLQALSDSILLVANFYDIQKLYDRFPDLERQGRRLTELFFVQKEEREAELIMLDAEKLYRLFRLQFPNLEKMVSQEHIASYLGISPSQLSRIQRKFY